MSAQIEAMAILNVVFGMTTIVGVILSVYFYRRSRDAHRQRFRYTWTDIEQGVQYLRDKVTKDFSPDVIIHPAGAGGVVANLFLLSLGTRIPMFEFMIEDPQRPWTWSPEHFSRLHSLRWDVRLPDSLASVPRGSRIVIVDAVCLTGSTVSALREKLADLGFERVRFAALLRVTPADGIVVVPDVYYIENPTNEWYWPWGKGR
jgi:hypoxanthine phosphoribosyltransferase